MAPCIRRELIAGWMILVITVMAIEKSSGSLYPHRHSKLSFSEFSKCRGTYDLAIYTWLSQICEDCEDKYRDPEIYRECRRDCFDNDYFKGCLNILQITEKKDDIKEGLSVIHPKFDRASLASSESA